MGGVREIHIKPLRDLVIKKVGRVVWSEKFCSEAVLLALIIDCQTLLEGGVLPNCLQTLNEIEVVSRTLCYKLHLHLDLTCTSKYCETVEVFVAMALDLSRSHPVFV